jgi:hypothetical protein
MFIRTASSASGGFRFADVAHSSVHSHPSPSFLPRFTLNCVRVKMTMMKLSRFATGAIAIAYCCIAVAGAVSLPDIDLPNIPINGVNSIDGAKQALCSARGIQDNVTCENTIKEEVNTCNTNYPTDNEEFGKCLLEAFNAPTALASQIPDAVWLALRYESGGSLDAGSLVSFICGTGTQANCTEDQVVAAFTKCAADGEMSTDAYAECVQNELGLSGLYLPDSVWDYVQKFADESSEPEMPGIFDEEIPITEWVDLALKTVGESWQEVCTPYNVNRVDECNALIQKATELCLDYLTTDLSLAAEFKDCFAQGLDDVYSSSIQHFLSAIALIAMLACSAYLF